MFTHHCITETPIGLDQLHFLLFPYFVLRFPLKNLVVTTRYAIKPANADSSSPGEQHTRAKPQTSPCVTIQSDSDSEHNF